MFATGLGRRMGALLLTGASDRNVAMAMPSDDASSEDKKQARPKLITQLALLGASILASQDLQGKPSLSWRTEQASKKAGKAVNEAGEKLSRKARKAAKKADKKAAKLSRKAHRAGKKLSSVAG